MDVQYRGQHRAYLGRADKFVGLMVSEKFPWGLENPSKLSLTSVQEVVILRLAHMVKHPIYSCYYLRSRDIRASAAPNQGSQTAAGNRGRSMEGCDRKDGSICFEGRHDTKFLR